MRLRRDGMLSACIVLVLAASLSACATDQQRTRSEGIAAGAAAGAVVGHAIGGDERGAALGAVLGGVVGAVFGNRAAEKKAAYAQREAELRAGAERAAALAQASREHNDQIEREIAQLEESVRTLRTAKLSARVKQNRATENGQRVNALLAATEARLQQIRAEVDRQKALLAVAAVRDDGKKKTAAEQPSQDFQLVSVNIRDLEQQTRRLELARLQLQQIDPRRAY